MKNIIPNNIQLIELSINPIATIMLPMAVVKAPYSNKNFLPILVSKYAVIIAPPNWREFMIMGMASFKEGWYTPTIYPPYATTAFTPHICCRTAKWIAAIAALLGVYAWPKLCCWFLSSTSKFLLFLSIISMFCWLFAIGFSCVKLAFISFRT